MKKPKIQTVCGYGCGSSLMHNVEIEAFCGDVATCCANDCDVIFISKELAQSIEERAKVPIVVFNNFMNKQEVEEKTLAYFETLK